MSNDYSGNTAFLRSLADGLTPHPLMTVAEWADNYRILSGRAAAEAGRYRTSRTRYMREIMEDLSPSSPVERVVFSARRRGKRCRRDHGQCAAEWKLLTRHSPGMPQPHPGGTAEWASNHCRFLRVEAVYADGQPSWCLFRSFRLMQAQLGWPARSTPVRMIPLMKEGVNRLADNFRKLCGDYHQQAWASVQTAFQEASCC